MLTLARHSSVSARAIPAALNGYGADRALRLPHVAGSVGVALTFTAMLIMMSGLYPRLVTSTWTVASASRVAIAFAVAAVGIALMTHRFRRMRYAVIGLAMLNSFPIGQYLATPLSEDSRIMALLLVMPTILAASGFPAIISRLQILVDIALTIIIFGVFRDQRVSVSDYLEVLFVIGVLTCASVLVNQVTQAMSTRMNALRGLAFTDGLTGLRNRRGLVAGFAQLRRAARKNDPIGVLIADIDHFKRFNDDYGHAAGDRVLTHVSALLAEAAGPTALLARTGGEELAAIIPGNIAAVSEKFHHLLTTVDPAVTVSIGIVEVTSSDAAAGPWALLAAADTALYEAKNTGRNRTCRATFNPTATVVAPALAVPRAAAVPETPHAPTYPRSWIPGWALLALSVIGIVSALDRHPLPLTELLTKPFFVAALAGALGGLVLSLTGLALRTRSIVMWALICDAVIVTSIIDFATVATRLSVSLPLLVTGLLVAQHTRRRILVAHHLVIVTVCALALHPDPTEPNITTVVVHGLVLIASAELTRWLRVRRDQAASDLHRWSVTDPLTGLANRRGLEVAFGRMPMMTRMAVLALDVDDFKGVNDRAGHAAGDDALIRLADTLRNVTQPGTILGRTGGDEFVVLSTGSRPDVLADVVRTAAGLLPLPLSVSIGTAMVLPNHQLSIWQVIAAADDDLIAIKRTIHAGTRGRHTRQSDSAHKSRPSRNHESGRIVGGHIDPDGLTVDDRTGQ